MLMSLAHFKAVSIDAHRPASLARFWAAALGGTAVRLRDGTARIDGVAGSHGETSIWVSPAGLPPNHRSRVRLGIGLHEDDLTDLTAAGALVQRKPDGAESSWTLTDTEGNPLRAYRLDDEQRSRSLRACELTVGCQDPVALAGWWADVTGGRLDRDAAGLPADSAATVAGAAGFPWQRWVFTAAGTPKTAKNRLYWEVTLVDADPAGLLRRGARVLRAPDADIDWWIMADPEGNEFCAFPAEPA
jgi:hypothetical protein